VLDQNFEFENNLELKPESQNCLELNLKPKTIISQLLKSKT